MCGTVLSLLVVLFVPPHIRVYIPLSGHSYILTSHCGAYPRPLARVCARASTDAFAHVFLFHLLFGLEIAVDDLIVVQEFNTVEQLLEPDECLMWLKSTGTC